MTHTTMRESIYPSENITLNMTVEVTDGNELDTTCELTGRFTVAGCQRAEFTKKLGQLINDYRI